MDVPILSMERASDYVLDAEWSPSHPSVFASSDAEGYIDLWNLNKDTEEPFNHYNVGDKAINKITWSNDAKKLAAGDSAGAIYIFNTDKEVYIYIYILIIICIVCNTKERRFC